MQQQVISSSKPPDCPPSLWLTLERILQNPAAFLDQNPGLLEELKQYAEAERPRDEREA